MEIQANQEKIEQWGLSLEAILGLEERLINYYEKYRLCTTTQTDDTSEYGFHYLSSQMRMETNRTMARTARVSGVSIQNMQQFMSDSPWSGRTLIGRVQSEIRDHPRYSTESVLILDESADEKSGETSAGSGRQHNGIGMESSLQRH